LGDVTSGITEQAMADAFAALDPATLRPAGGSCDDCASRDGCGHFCPASGALLAGDMHVVPAVVCRLVRAQVEAIRPYVAWQRRRAPSVLHRCAEPLLAAAAAGRPS
jgi:hypothetical protein